MCSKFITQEIYDPSYSYEEKEGPCCGKSWYHEAFYSGLEKFYRKL
jgi:hypothetical protein